MRVVIKLIFYSEIEVSLDVLDVLSTVFMMGKELFPTQILAQYQTYIRIISHSNFSPISNLHLRKMKNSNSHLSPNFR